MSSHAVDHGIKSSGCRDSAGRRSEPRQHFSANRMSANCLQLSRRGPSRRSRHHCVELCHELSYPACLCDYALKASEATRYLADGYFRAGELPVAFRPFMASLGRRVGHEDEERDAANNDGEAYIDESVMTSDVGGLRAVPCLTVVSSKLAPFWCLLARQPLDRPVGG
ncbi:hypothetical protein IF1G_11093 [Cordyceps javanica]|uniref:Uncharacterized protein n=1 Tax=Cordyceps javanica TaxID=43265 RepID=A0A545ULC5_9HYPO|nr:hypothetical protein IF1G_11093 [Cordyceps javanica]